MYCLIAFFVELVYVVTARRVQCDLYDIASVMPLAFNDTSKLMLENGQGTLKPVTHDAFTRDSNLTLVQSTVIRPRRCLIFHAVLTSVNRSDKVFCIIEYVSV